MLSGGAFFFSLNSYPIRMVLLKAQLTGRTNQGLEFLSLWRREANRNSSAAKTQESFQSARFFQQRPRIHREFTAPLQPLPLQPCPHFSASTLLFYCKTVGDAFEYNLTLFKEILIDWRRRRWFFRTFFLPACLLVQYVFAAKIKTDKDAKFGLKVWSPYAFWKNTILNCFLAAQDTAEPISSENRVQLWQEQHFLSRRRAQELKVLKLIFFNL